MAIDITVFPKLSPRIVVIDSPQTEATLQDIIDAIRAWEDSQEGFSYPYLIDAAGKEDLGGGVTVGITATLQNAQIRFEAQTTPLSSGTVTTGDTDGETLIDSGADFETDGVYRGATAFNATTGAMQTIVTVREHEIDSFPLLGGTRQDWQIGDSYTIYPNVECFISGGNLVANDENGDTISAVMQSPNVFVSRTSSSSATLQELFAIQFASFDGGVTVDLVNGVSGTVYPIGTPLQPVGNLADALTIADANGFGVFYILGNAALDSGLDYTAKIFVGESQTKTNIVISDAAQVTNCEFYDATVSGTLDGNAKLRNCAIGTLNYINGIVEQCLLQTGTITLGGSDEAHFLDCWSGVGHGSPPTIDMGGSGQDLSLRNYNGGIAIANKSGVDDCCTIDLNSGHVHLLNTVTAGCVRIRGIGQLTDESVGADVYDDYLVNPDTIAAAVASEMGVDLDTLLKKINFIAKEF